jgi:hypothetical protein
MSYTAPCLVVHRTVQNQENLVGTGRFLSKHDRLGTVSGCWKLDPDRAASCAYLLVATNGVVVDVARILGAETVPVRWTKVTTDEEVEGLRPIDKNRVAVITAPTVPKKIERLIGQPVDVGRNPVRYVTIAVNGSAVIESVEDETDEDRSRLDRYIEAALVILVEVARAATTITYGSLAERIVDDTGIEERRPLNWWIGTVLGEISKVNHARNEPFLSSLVVSATSGQVGDGYVIPVRDLLGEDPDDLEEHAALQRVRCYRFFAAKAD